MEDSNTLHQDLLKVSCCSASSPSLDQNYQVLKEKDGKIEISEEGEKLSVDQILDKYVGAFGQAQVIHVLIVSLAWAFDSLHTLVAIFSDAVPAWQCVKPKTLDLAINNATSATSERWCTEQSALCEMDPSMWEWVEGNGASVVSEWGLICDDKFKAGIPASLFFVGCILGAGILGSLADTCLGRKRTLMLSCFIMSASGFLTALSPNVWIYSLLRLLTGFGRAGVGICSLVLSTELVGHKWRGQIGLYGFLFFTAGFASLPAIAYVTRSSWRTTYILISSLSMTYTCTILPFAWESPRWLAIRNRQAEAVKVLRQMATWNAKSFPGNLSVTADGRGSSNFTAILRAPWARRRMSVLLVVGTGTGLVYYGMPLNVGNLEFDPYVNTLLNSLMEVPAIAVGAFLLPRADRKILVSVSSGIYALCCIVCGVVNGGWVQVAAELAGFLAVCITFELLYVFCLELFSTDVRSVAVAMLRQAVMAGAAVAPAVVVVGRTCPVFSFVVFAAFGVLGAVVTLVLPETRNRPVYDTMEEQKEEEEGEKGRKSALRAPLLA